MSASALYSLQKKAYEAHQETSDIQISFVDWCEQKELQHPQFSYWYKSLKLELLFLQLIKSQREANFEQYVTTLEEIIPWMFAMDHYLYARWLTVHVCDLMQLKNVNPTTYEQFIKGHFVTHKTPNKFSALAHDQVDEHLNAVVKGEGGVIGITEDESALRRWMVAGPEISRMLNEFSLEHLKKTARNDRHHEQLPSTQRTFAEDVTALIRIIEDRGNLFLDDGVELLTLDSNVIMSEEVVQTIRKAESLGKE